MFKSLIKTKKGNLKEKFQKLNFLRKFPPRRPLEEVF